MYAPELVAPMKADLTDIGFQQLTTATEVEQVLNLQEGTTFLVVNSVCGCASGAALPAVKEAMSNEKLPTRMVTVFAGVDSEAVQKARDFMAPYPQSSPSMAIFKDGKLVHFIERHQIEGNNAESISGHLKQVFNHFC